MSEYPKAYMSGIGKPFVVIGKGHKGLWFTVSGTCEGQSGMDEDEVVRAHGFNPMPYDASLMTVPGYPRMWKVPDEKRIFLLSYPSADGAWIEPYALDMRVAEYSDFRLTDALRLEGTDGWKEITNAKPIDDVGEFSRLQKITAQIVTGDIESGLTERQRLALGCVKTLIADKMFEGKKWICKEVAGQAVKLADEMMLALEDE